MTDLTASNLSALPISARLLPPGFQEAGFDGDVGFTPAFDRRSLSEGIGGLDLVFWLRGPKDGAGQAFGAVSWRLMTGCFLPKTQAEWLSKFAGSSYKSTPDAIDFHSALPDDDPAVPRLDCLLLGPGRSCYGEAQYGLGEKAYEALVTGGEPSLWAFLREMYDSRFSLEDSRFAV